MELNRQTDKQTNMKEDPVERGTWGNQIEFILSLVGYAVGLGNIWRFPYLTYNNGGGAFLVPYVIMLIIAGLPLFFLELSFGQFGSLGPITIWKACPLFKGVGYGMVAISTMVSIYYNVIIMYSVFYMCVSLISLDTGLPWEKCNNEWNTKWCIEYNKENPNFTLDLHRKFCPDLLNGANLTVAANNLTFCGIKNFTTASQEYWTNVVLQLNGSSGIGDLGSVSLRNVIFLLLTWIIIYFCLRNGVKSSGKVVYFTATFPYVMLIVLLIRGVTLEGYMDGIRFYIIPKWEKLKNVKVWADAATQIFYSLGPAFGGLITMSSYNKFNNNCYRDALMVSIINCGTSVFGGFVIFSVLGYMSYVTGRPVETVAQSGSGLVFVVYPEGLARMPVSSLWSFLFFFMIFTLGLDSQFAMMETVISSIIDEFPSYLRHHKQWVTITCCLICFLLGIPMVTSGGMYVLTLMDSFSGSYGLMIVCLCELIAVSWIYGLKRFRSDIKMMLGFEPGIYWMATWAFITPVAIVFIFIMSAINQTKAKYVNYTFEFWAQGLGWMMVVIPIALIIITGIIQSILHIGDIRKVIQPTKDWGPALIENRTGIYAPGHSMESGLDNMAYTNDVKKAISDGESTNL